MKIAFNDTAELTLVHPVTGDNVENDGNEAVIIIYGTQSETYRAAKLARDNKITSHRGGIPSAEKMESFNLDLLAECTKEFRNVDIGNGAVPTEKAKGFYRKNAWARQQVDEGMADDARFLVKESTVQNDG